MRQIKAKQFFDQVMQELRKNREIQLNQQTIRCQVLADMIKIWSCLIFIKLYTYSFSQKNTHNSQVATTPHYIGNFIL